MPECQFFFSPLFFKLNIHWPGLLQNPWPGILQNEWPGILRNHWQVLVQNSHQVEVSDLFHPLPEFFTFFPCKLKDLIFVHISKLSVLDDDFSIGYDMLNIP